MSPVAAEPCEGHAEVNRGDEKPAEVFYPTCDAAEISLLETPGVQMFGVVHHVSKCGLRMETGLPVMAGSRLKISLRKRAIVFGRARDCRRTEKTYQVEVDIESAYYPSRAASSLLQISSSEPGPASGALARSIVRHHLSLLAASPNFPCRVPPDPGWTDMIVSQPVEKDLD